MCYIDESWALKSFSGLGLFLGDVVNLIHQKLNTLWADSSFEQAR